MSDPALEAVGCDVAALPRTGRFHLRFLEETPSTNDEVKRALEAGEAEGLVVRARRQVSGYGRQGRAWASPEGGLYCSLLLRPQVEPIVLPTLSLVVGIAVRRAIVALVGASAGEAVQIKWPNDVVVVPGRSDARACAAPERMAQNHRCERFLSQGQKSDLGFCDSDAQFEAENRAQRQFCANGDSAGTLRGVSALAPAKLCGISLEAQSGGVCVGVGVNVLPPDERPDVGGKNRPAYVADFAVERGQALSVEAVLESFLVAFAPLYEKWMREGFAPFVNEFNAHAALIGRAVSIVDRAGATLAEGVVQRVDDQGQLRIRSTSGVEMPITSGEAHLV